VPPVNELRHVPRRQFGGTSSAGRGASASRARRERCWTCERQCCPLVQVARLGSRCRLTRIRIRLSIFSTNAMSHVVSFAPTDERLEATPALLLGGRQCPTSLYLESKLGGLERRLTDLNTRLSHSGRLEFASDLPSDGIRRARFDVEILGEKLRGRPRRGRRATPLVCGRPQLRG
jgi:hypothetical protein